MRPMDPGDVSFIVDLHRQPHVRDLLFAPKAERVQRALANSSVEHHIVLNVGPWHRILCDGLGA